MQLLLLISVSVITCIYAADGPDEPQLVYSSVVFRHGDRSPIDLYPTDPYPAYIWTAGLGQLTNEGKQRLYDLGIWLKNRYKNSIIRDQYNLTTIVVNSSDVDRTIMSAQCLLAGMYPPNGEQVWNPHINWQPIPIHTKSKDTDNMIGFMKQCDKYDSELNALSENSYVQTLFKKYKSLFEYVSKHAGVKFTGNHVEDFDDLFTIYNALKIEKSHNLTLPSWTEQIYSELGEAAPLSLWLFSYTVPLQRFRAGPILKDIIQLMDGKKDGTTPMPRNITLYSGHDYIIASLLCSFDAFNMRWVPYGATILFEMYKDKHDEYTVKVFFKNSTNGDLYNIKVKGCSSPCTLNSFKSALSKLLPNNWDMECRNNDNGKSDNIQFSVVIVVVFVLLLAIILVVRYCILRVKRKQDSYEPY